MDLSDLIDRNAAFTPDKAAIRFRAARSPMRPSLRASPPPRARSSRELGIGRGDRVAILAANHPDYLVLLYACARLGAMLVPLNWRLAVPEQLFILSDASVKVLVVEEAFAAVVAPLRQALPDVTRRRPRLRAGRRGTSFDAAAGRRHAATAATRTSISPARCSLVYTSGTTGRPKGAVLRQEALVWNAVMSQHMHDMTRRRSRADRAAAVPRRRAQHPDHAGAAARRHRHDPSALRARCDARTRSREDRPTLTVLVPATIQALIEHPRWAATDLSTPARGHHRLDPGAAAADRRLHRARRAGAAGLRLDRDLPDRGLYPRSAAICRACGSTGLPGLVLRGARRRRRRPRGAARHAGEVVVRGPNVFFEYWGNAAATARRCATAGITPATSARATPTAISTSTTARRT